MRAMERQRQRQSLEESESGGAHGAGGRQRKKSKYLSPPYTYSYADTCTSLPSPENLSIPDLLHALLCTALDPFYLLCTSSSFSFFFRRYRDAIFLRGPHHRLCPSPSHCPLFLPTVTPPPATIPPPPAIPAIPPPPTNTIPPPPPPPAMHEHEHEHDLQPNLHLQSPIKRKRGRPRKSDTLHSRSRSRSHPHPLSHSLSHSLQQATQGQVSPHANHAIPIANATSTSFPNPVPVPVPGNTHHLSDIRNNLLAMISSLTSPPAPLHLGLAGRARATLLHQMQALLFKVQERLANSSSASASGLPPP